MAINTVRGRWCQQPRTPRDGTHPPGEPDDEIALETTTNSDAIAIWLLPLIAKVVVSNPRKTRVITKATMKTDNVDAGILARLLAAEFLPGTWLAE